MTKGTVRFILETKVYDMSIAVKRVGTAVSIGDKHTIDIMVNKLEREIDAFKRLANGANLGQKEETK